MESVYAQYISLFYCYFSHLSAAVLYQLLGD